MKETVRVTKWVAGGIDRFLLGIPVIGASIIIGLVWVPLASYASIPYYGIYIIKKEDLHYNR